VSESRTHVVGAGVAGLAAAVSLVRAGRTVTLYEASGQAGGRCRSYVDAKLGCAIDNGNHLLLSGNRGVMRYLAEIGADDALLGPASASFPFLDLRSGRRWCLRPNRGLVPWWIFDEGRRVPETTAWSYLGAMSFATAGPGHTVRDLVGDDGVLFERFWEPLAVAVLNTPACTGAARLLWPVLRETFLRGERACRPRIARTGLSAALVDPALDFLRYRGAVVRFGRRLRAMGAWQGRATDLDFGTETVALRRGDSVVLAVPPSAASSLVPGLTVPGRSHTVVNAHFRLPAPGRLPPELPFLGLIGGVAQWLFVRSDIASVTVSAADRLAAEPAETIARKTWKDVAAALDLEGAALPTYRILKERRATFAQTPEEIRRRPPMRGTWTNVYLAGDWVETGLPATIEGAIRSGHMAAQAVVRARNP